MKKTKTNAADKAMEMAKPKNKKAKSSKTLAELAMTATGSKKKK